MASKIIVEGFKSIGERVEVEIRPLTLLAGANSSGKSSLIQAILLLKQTLEAPYDPGPVLLNGPNVRFTSIEQLLHLGGTASRRKKFTVGFQTDSGSSFEVCLEQGGRREGVAIAKFVHRSRSGSTLTLSPKMDAEQLTKEWESQQGRIEKGFHPKLGQNRFILSLSFQHEKNTSQVDQNGSITGTSRSILPSFGFDFSILTELLHLPGLRGNPERSYPLAASGPTFPGTFERYTASIISRWGASQKQKLKQLSKNLQKMGLTGKVESKKLDDANLELRVARLSHPVKDGDNDLVNIADVGFGVSQTLPVLVALLEADPGQVVYIEQPEIHLHPRAQVAMASLLADAAKRGVQLVVETHSSLLLLAVQTLVAEEDLDPGLVKLHWFTRDEKSGATRITSADLDEAGRFGDWPEDFDDVSLTAQSHYLDAVEAAVAKE